MFLNIKLCSGLNYKAFGALLVSFISKGGRVVKFGMCSVWDNFKVFDSVVRGIVVDMVNNLPSFKRSANMSFHDKSVFVLLFSIYRHYLVTIRANASKAIRVFLECVWTAVSSLPHVVLKAKANSMDIIRTILNFACFHKRNSNRNTHEIQLLLLGVN